MSTLLLIILGGVVALLVSILISIVNLAGCDYGYWSCLYCKFRKKQRRHQRNPRPQDPEGTDEQPRMDLGNCEDCGGPITRKNADWAECRACCDDDYPLSPIAAGVECEHGNPIDPGAPDYVCVACFAKYSALPDEHDAPPCQCKTPCSVSTGIHEGITRGKGALDDNGFWEFPCSSRLPRKEL